MLINGWDKQSYDMDTVNLNIVVPCFNEEKNISAFYRSLKSILIKYVNSKVIFVDDGSNDLSLKVIKEIASIDDSVFYISFSRNFGQQSALKAGFDYSIDADCAICMDADLQHPPELIDELIEKWREGYEVVSTIRIVHGEYSWTRKILNSFFYGFINKISSHKIIQNGPDYRLLDKKVLKVISNFSEENMYIKEVTSWVGFRKTTIDFYGKPRVNGQSHYSFWSLLNLSLKGITSFSISPLRASIFIGLITSCVAFIYGFYSLYIKLFTHEAISGWTSIIASLLFMSGIQFILIGIIGEYLGRTYLESKRRPTYIISESRLSEVYEEGKVPTNAKNAV